VRPDAPRTRPFLASLWFLIAALWLWSPMVACARRSTLELEESALDSQERPPLDFIARTEQGETKRASPGPGSAPEAGFAVPEARVDSVWRAFPCQQLRAPTCAWRGGIYWARGPPAAAWLA